MERDYTARCERLYELVRMISKYRRWLPNLWLPRKVVPSRTENTVMMECVWGRRGVGWGLERERGRGRETERERETHTHTDTERRETDRQRDRQRNRNIFNDTGLCSSKKKQKNLQNNKQHGHRNTDGGKL